MTGFASSSGALAPHAWSWELRSVNGKGQDLRLRVPDWIAGLEIGLRRKLAAATARGAITLSLRLSRDEAAAGFEINGPQLDATLRALAAIEARAGAAGLTLAPSRAADLLSLRGILEQGGDPEDTGALAAALFEQADALIEDFNAMRSAEGAALCEILTAQLNEIAALLAQAAQLAGDRAESQSAVLRRNLDKLLQSTDASDPGRLAQELAMIAVKTDVTEEIDRLGAHVEAARALLAEGGPVGRKLDFLMQEFNREANTLCAKAQQTELTRCGLALKAVIDQMREQVQNVE